MLRTVSTRCKPSPQIISKRLRSTSSQQTKPNKKWSSAKRAYPSKYYSLPRPADSPFLLPAARQVKGAPPAHLAVDKCHEYFLQEVQNWSTDDRTLMRFVKFGYDADTIRPFLAAYVSTAQSGFFSSPKNFEKYQLTRFTTCGIGYVAGDVSDKPHLRLLDAEITFSNIFFSWIASEGDSGVVLEKLVEEGKARREALLALRHLAIVSERRPAEHFGPARKTQRRFIMHVGPTNSGKTHHALRALAAAKSGVYAGPLRLLAYEIWERLNLGQIVPLGVDVPPPSTSPPSEVQIADKSIAPEAKIHSNPDYARLTNMITGEERKIVVDNAPLLTCTVEMLSFRHQYDVGVIDEIQMIGDPQRGFAWTDAVLGLCAKEIHLCGEESAIPVIQELLKETGDELTVRRYERLTPLNVEEKSLDGDLSKVVKGDCVVAFSRTRIFEIKREIEEKSGLRCAVVYGKLPPEIRSEQAALFNDPDSGFDVIIGSDAIGMGLNLKIRRIIFDQTTKPNADNRHNALSISQIKQIAGRAGRYGHSLTGEKPGGFATTLYERDLPVLREALTQSSTPTLTHAYIGPTLDSFAAIAPALLPPLLNSDTTTRPKLVDLETAQMAHIYTALPPSPIYKHCRQTRLSEICTWIEKQSKGVFTWDDKLQIMFSPITWRDEVAVEAAEEMAGLQREEMCVIIRKMGCIFGGGVKGKSGLIRALEEMERLMEEVERERERERESVKLAVNDSQAALTQVQSSPSNYTSPPTSSSSLSSLNPPLSPTSTKIDQRLLEQLEALHKILVLYMWSHLRNPVVYPDRETADNLKHRVEVVLDWGLREVGQGEKVGLRMRKGRERKGAVEGYKEEVDMGVYGWSPSKVGKMEMDVGKKKGKEKGRGREKEGKRGRDGEEKTSLRSTSRGGRTKEDYAGGLRSFENYNSRRSSSPLPPPWHSPSPPSSSLLDRYLFDTSSSPRTTLSSPSPSVGFSYPPPAGSPRLPLSSRTSGIASAIASAKAKSGLGISSVGSGGVIGNSNVSPTGWTQAPDLTALLKMYVDNPSLRVDGGRSGNRSSASGGVRK